MPFEVIIGDDDSRDATRLVCEEYVKRYPDMVRLMDKAPNKGVLQNYYDCVRVARGEYIMECGGDDEWCPGRINLCLDIMEQHPDVLQVFTDVWLRYIRTGRVVQSSARGIIQPGMVKGDDASRVMFNNWPAYYAMTRRSVIMELMADYPRFFNGREYLTEDHQLAVLVGTKGNVYYVAEPTYYYNKGESLSCSADESNIGRFHLNMLLLMHDLASVVELPSWIVNDGLNQRLFKVLMHAFRAKNKELRGEAVSVSHRLHMKNVCTKVRICIFVTSNDVTWFFALYLRRLFVFVKSLREKRIKS